MRDPRRNPNTPFLYVDISAIDRSLKIITSAPEILGANAPSRARKEIREGDILVSTVRPNLNAVAVVPQHLDGQIASTGFCVLRPNKSVIVGKYLFYFTTTPNFVDIISGKVRGAHYPAVSDSDIKKIELPLPPVSEQCRIVEILDHADVLRKKRAEANAKAARILSALFYKMFGDPVTNSKEWPCMSLGQVLSSIDGGWSPRCLDRPANDDEWGVLKLGAVTWGHYDASENKALPSDLEARPDIDVRNGDVLFSRKNTHELIAACTMVHRTRPRIMMSDLIFRLNIRDKKELLPEYLSVLLGQTSKRAEIQKLASGAAGSMPNISKTRLKSVMIPIPPIQLQRTFSTILTRYIDLNEIRQNSDSLIQNLFQLILHKAFTGNLTAKWREAHMKELLKEMELQVKYLEEVS